MRGYLLVTCFYLATTAINAVAQPAASQIRSAGDLAGKWISHQETPEFSGDLTLKLRTDGTFTLITDGTRDGQRVGGISRGNWQWTGEGPIIRLSDRPGPLDLRSFQRSLTFFTTGSAAAVYFATLAVSFILSLFLLWRYRRHVHRLMGTAAQPESPRAESFQDSEPALTAVDDVPETAAYVAMKRQRQKTLAAYAIAGMCQAVPATFFWITNGGLPLHRWLFLTLLVVHAWPVLIAHFILLGRNLRARAVLTTGYLALLGIIAVASGVQPMVTNGIRLSATGQIYFLWAGLMLVPTFAVWCFLRRRIRAAGPLTFTLCLFPMIGAWIGLVLMDQDYGAASDALFNYVDSTVFFAGVLIIAALSCLPVGWFLGRFVGRLYGRKILNDQTITMDALWLNFSLVESVHFALDKGVLLGVGQALLLFGVYRLVLTIAFLWLRRNSTAANSTKLLVLRVFRSDRGADRLMEVVGGRWVYTGSIQMIGGTDLATSTVRPYQFLDFIRRRLDSYFLKNREELNQRLAELDFDSDPDGRYRVNEMLCQGDIWREAVQRLAETTDAVLMDLRGFHMNRQGCRFELRVLFERVPLHKVVLLIDRSTNEGDFREAIREARQSVQAGGPNDNTETSVRVFTAPSVNARTGVRICKALLWKAESPASGTAAGVAT